MSRLDNLEADVKGEHGDKRRNTVIAVGTLVLVVLAYLTYQALAGGGGATSSDVTTPSDGSVDATPGAAADQSDNSIYNAIMAQTSALTSQLGILSKQEKVTNRELKNANTKLKKLEHPAKKKGTHHAPITLHVTPPPSPRKPKHPATHTGGSQTHKPKHPVSGKKAA